MSPDREHSTLDDFRVLNEFQVLRDWAELVLTGQVIPDATVVDVVVDTARVLRALTAADLRLVHDPRLGSPPEWAVAELEALARLGAVREVVGAVLRGELALDEHLAGSITKLAGEAARWATVSRAMAA